MHTSSVNVAEIALSISDEFFVVDGTVLTSQRGLARICGVNEASIRYQIKRLSVRVKTVEKTFKTLQKGDFSVRVNCLNSKDSVDLIKYYAYDSKKGSNEIAKAFDRDFTEKGYIDWVSKILNLEPDTTHVDASIATRLGLYPGFKTVTKNASLPPGKDYLTVREWLEGFTDLDAEHVTKAVPSVAFKTAASFKVNKGVDPVKVKGDRHYVTSVYSSQDWGSIEASFNKYQSEQEEKRKQVEAKQIKTALKRINAESLADKVADMNARHYAANELRYTVVKLAFGSDDLDAIFAGDITTVNDGKLESWVKENEAVISLKLKLSCGDVERLRTEVCKQLGFKLIPGRNLGSNGNRVRLYTLEPRTSEA